MQCSACADELADALMACGHAYCSLCLDALQMGAVTACCVCGAEVVAAAAPLRTLDDCEAGIDIDTELARVDTRIAAMRAHREQAVEYLDQRVAAALAAFDAEVAALVAARAQFAARVHACAQTFYKAQDDAETTLEITARQLRAMRTHSIRLRAPFALPALPVFRFDVVQHGALPHWEVLHPGFDPTQCAVHETTAHCAFRSWPQLELTLTACDNTRLCAADLVNSVERLADASDMARVRTRGGEDVLLPILLTAPLVPPMPSFALVQDLTPSMQFAHVRAASRCGNYIAGLETRRPRESTMWVYGIREAKIVFQKLSVGGSEAPITSMALRHDLESTYMVLLACKRDGTLLDNLVFGERRQPSIEHLAHGTLVTTEYEDVLLVNYVAMNPVPVIVPVTVSASNVFVAYAVTLPRSTSYMRSDGQTVFVKTYEDAVMELPLPLQHKIYCHRSYALVAAAGHVFVLTCGMVDDDNFVTCMDETIPEMENPSSITTTGSHIVAMYAEGARIRVFSVT